jgi:ribokinase
MSITVLGSYIHAHCLGVHGLPQSGESMMADCLWSDFGGKGLNLALGLNQLGVDVYTLLAVGGMQRHRGCRFIYKRWD